MGKYVWRKVKLLEQFGVEADRNVVSHLMRLPSEIAVDNAVRTLLVNMFDNELFA